MTRTSTIRHIVLDIGGVVLNIDEQASFDAFASLGCSEKSLRDILGRDDLFINFEKGLMAPDRFRRRVIEGCGLEISSGDFDKAWCAMLLDIPEKRASCLESLSHRFELHLLSNTNAIHLDQFKTYCYNTATLTGWDHWFQHCFFSNELHMRKPEPAIFQRVTEVLACEPGHIFFIDDTPANVEEAKKHGWQAMLLKRGEALTHVIRTID